MLKPEQMLSIFNDICNFQLVIFGIGITLFTVLYSFILNKRDDLRGYSELIKFGKADPLTLQKNELAKSYINRFKKVNNHLINIVIIALLIYVASWIVKEFLIVDQIQIPFYILSSLTIFTLGYISLIIWQVLKHYKYSTKI